MKVRVMIAAGLLAAGALAQSRDPRPPGLLGPVEEGAALLGTAAPSLEGVRWLDGKAHPLGGDAGKVVLVRWWTDGCAFCANTAPALRALAEKHGPKLDVLAIYHPKPRPRAVDDTSAADAARRLGLPFVIGVDPDWTALRRWWLRGEKRRYTSVTFLVDAHGRIRAIHTGTEFHAAHHVAAEDCQRSAEACGSEFRALDAAIAELLAAKSGR